MKKRIVTINAYHQEAVARAVEELQKDGFEVQHIDRIEKMVLGVIGNDVTEITYNPCQTNKRIN